MTYNRDITKTIDFLAGYAYKGLEKEVVKALCIEKPEIFPVKYEISIPWAWCTRRGCESTDMWSCRAEAILLQVGTQVAAELERTFPTSRLISSAFVHNGAQGWRSEINFEVHQEPKPVEMTIEEIEAKLGHKIKIVGDK